MTEGHTISRRQALAAGTASVAASVLSPSLSPSWAGAATSKVLLELFTSQGCLSCPPADALAGELASDPSLMVLSYNVDYWDYIGWRDTLAKPEFSQRQYDYARARGDGKVYTPQIVVNGTDYAVGSSRANVQAMIDAAKNLPAHVNLSIAENEITAEVAQFMPIGEATLWLMAVKREKTQEITRGENAGKTITYHNVVSNMVPAAMWRGEALRASWMKNAVMPSGADFCVAVLQREKTGPVLGIARA